MIDQKYLRRKDESMVDYVLRIQTAHFKGEITYDEYGQLVETQL